MSTITLGAICRRKSAKGTIGCLLGSWYVAPSARQRNELAPILGIQEAFNVLDIGKEANALLMEALGVLYLGNVRFVVGT